MTSACLALSLALAAGVEISISADPPLPPPNLLKNGDIEQGTDNKPLHWRWGTAVPQNFQVGWVKQGRKGSHCLYIKSKSGVMSGYWSQTVRVEPGRPYRLIGWFRLASGKLLAYVHGRTRTSSLDRRFYWQSPSSFLFLVPTFLKREYLKGPGDWYPLRVDFTPPDGMRAVTVSVGMYFAAGEVWYDDLAVIPARTDLSVQIRSDTDIRRVLVFGADVSKPIYDSGNLPKGTRQFERRLKGVDTSVSYRVRVITADGKTVERTYPGGCQK